MVNSNKLLKFDEKEENAIKEILKNDRYFKYWGVSFANNGAQLSQALSMGNFYIMKEKINNGKFRYSFCDLAYEPLYTFYDIKDLKDSLNKYTSSKLNKPVKIDENLSSLSLSNSNKKTIEVKLNGDDNQKTIYYKFDKEEEKKYGPLWNDMQPHGSIQDYVVDDGKGNKYLKLESSSMSKDKIKFSISNNGTLKHHWYGDCNEFYKPETEEEKRKLDQFLEKVPFLKDYYANNEYLMLHRSKGKPSIGLTINENGEIEGYSGGKKIAINNDVENPNPKILDNITDTVYTNYFKGKSDSLSEEEVRNSFSLLTSIMFPNNSLKEYSFNTDGNNIYIGNNTLEYNGEFLKSHDKFFIENRPSTNYNIVPSKEGLKLKDRHNFTGIHIEKNGNVHYYLNGKYKGNWRVGLGIKNFLNLLNGMSKLKYNNTTISELVQKQMADNQSNNNVINNKHSHVDTLMKNRQKTQNNISKVIEQALVDPNNKQCIKSENITLRYAKNIISILGNVMKNDGNTRL